MLMNRSFSELNHCSTIEKRLTKLPQHTVMQTTHTDISLTTIFQLDILLILFRHLFQTHVSSWDRPKLSMTSLTLFHHVFIRRPLRLTLHCYTMFNPMCIITIVFNMAKPPDSNFPNHRAPWFKSVIWKPHTINLSQQIYIYFIYTTAHLNTQIL